MRHFQHMVKMAVFLKADSTFGAESPPSEPKFASHATGDSWRTRFFPSVETEG